MTAIRSEGPNASTTEIANANSAYDDMVWRRAYTTTAAKSGAATLTPATAANQISPVTGNITSLTCALTATYPYVIWTATTDGTYTLNLTGWETDGGNSVTLTATGKDSFILYTPDGGTTKFFAKWMGAIA